MSRIEELRSLKDASIFLGPKHTEKPSQLDRIERKVDALAELLAVLLESVQQEDEDHPSFDLDGNLLPQERDENQSLG